MSEKEVLRKIKQAYNLYLKKFGYISKKDVPAHNAWFGREIANILEFEYGEEEEIK